MSSNLRERFVARVAEGVSRLGFSSLIFSPSLRKIAKKLFLGPPQTAPSVQTIASGIGKGLRLKVLPQTPRSFTLGFFELEIQDTISQTVHPGQVVYDCGANIGFYTAIFASRVGEKGKVYAFEPSSHSLECLKEVSTLNDFHNLIIVPKAIWEKSETLRFVRDAQTTSTTEDHVETVLGANEDKGRTVIEIPAVSIDDFVMREGHRPPDFIKIDVEGSETQAILGAREVLARFKPKILVEIHGAYGYAAFDALRSCDYIPTNIANGTVPNTAEEFSNSINRFLAVHRSS